VRLRRRNKRTIDITPDFAYSERKKEPDEDFDETKIRPAKKISKEKPGKKPSKNKANEKNKDQISNVINVPASLFRKIVQNPNFSSQMMVIVFSLLSDNVPMARPLENMSTAIDKARNISDVLSNTMQSVKVATEVPKQIRQLMQ
jgi:hypothetical protein